MEDDEIGDDKGNPDDRAAETEDEKVSDALLVPLIQSHHHVPTRCAPGTGLLDSARVDGRLFVEVVEILVWKGGPSYRPRRSVRVGKEIRKVWRCSYAARTCGPHSGRDAVSGAVMEERR